MGKIVYENDKGYIEKVGDQYFEMPYGGCFGTALCFIFAAVIILLAIVAPGIFHQ